MKSIPLVYIAGPLSAPTTWEILQNIHWAQSVGLAVGLLGALPIIPHANTGVFFGHGDETMRRAGYLELLRRCDALLLIEGWKDSEGSIAEYEEAIRRDMPIYDDMAFLGEWIDAGAPSSQKPSKFTERPNKDISLAEHILRDCSNRCMYRPRVKLRIEHATSEEPSEPSRFAEWLAWRPKRNASKLLDELPQVDIDPQKVLQETRGSGIKLARPVTFPDDEEPLDYCARCGEVSAIFHATADSVLCHDCYGKQDSSEEPTKPVCAQCGQEPVAEEDHVCDQCDYIDPAEAAVIGAEPPVVIPDDDIPF